MPADAKGRGSPKDSRIFRGVAGHPERGAWVLGLMIVSGPVNSGAWPAGRVAVNPILCFPVTLTLSWAPGPCDALPPQKN